MYTYLYTLYTTTQRELCFGKNLVRKHVFHNGKQCEQTNSRCRKKLQGVFDKLYQFLPNTWTLFVFVSFDEIFPLEGANCYVNIRNTLQILLQSPICQLFRKSMKGTVSDGSFSPEGKTNH